MFSTISRMSCVAATVLSSATVSFICARGRLRQDAKSYVTTIRHFRILSIIIVQAKAIDPCPGTRRRAAAHH